jgi:ABC-type Fe3+/spermidine/putrescine transport system ATPase subunit
MIVVERLRFSVGRRRGHCGATAPGETRVETATDRPITDGGPFALQDISLEVPRGEYFVLLGPSGSGKTLFLESLCGLHRIDSGRILVQGVDVTRLEPRRRRIGYLPQDYALFPHLSVRANVAFGLRNPLSQWFDARDARIDELLRVVDLEPLAGRRPDTLSGGEKQRVALARALAVQPHVLLLDEPVSALDEQMRDALCRQMKQLQRRTGTATIHVCHNFAEMLAVADRVGVIRGGRIVQVGTPQDVLQRPRNRFVAHFVQAGNVLTGRTASDSRGVRIACAEGLEFLAECPGRPAAERNVAFVIRPENIGVSPGEPSSPGINRWLGAIRELADLGALVRLAVECGGGTTVQALLGRKECASLHVRPGDRVTLTVEPADVHVLEDD